MRKMFQNPRRMISTAPKISWLRLESITPSRLSFATHPNRSTTSFTIAK